MPEAVLFSQEISRENPFSINMAGTTVKGDCRTFERNCYPYNTVEFVIEGEGELIIDGLRYRIRENDVYLLPRHHDHKTCSTPKNTWRKTYFVADGLLVDALLVMYGLSGCYHYEACPRELEEKFTQIRDLFLNHVPDYNLKAAVIVHEIIIELYKMAQVKRLGLSKQVMEMKSLLDRGLNQKINLDELCSRFHRSKSHVIRLFKREIGLTPYDYLLANRLESAKTLLRHGNVSVKEIARRLCFSDPYHFSAFFKKKTGLSPRAFKASFD